jgi:t-SNARE complex subunit (syntaxin)
VSNPPPLLLMVATNPCQLFSPRYKQSFLVLVLAQFTFFMKVTFLQAAIKEYNSNVTKISDLQSRLLNVLDDNSGRQIQAQIDDLAAETQTLGNSLRARIQRLATWPAKGQDIMIRKNQVRQFIDCYLVDILLTDH